MFASEVQHLFVLISLLYFGVNGLLRISFTVYIYKRYKVRYPVAGVLFSVYLSVLSAAFGHTRVLHLNVFSSFQRPCFLLPFSLLL